VTDDGPACPECASEYSYELGDLIVCSMCGHEWSAAESDADTEAAPVIKDSVGNVLADGDTVIVVKDLKVKGSATAIKVGTKVRNIRLVEGVGDHDIDCKVDGFGPMQLKSSVVKKA
jgi:protein PhnA